MKKRMQKIDFLIIGGQEPMETRLEDNSNVFKGIPPYFTPYGKDFIRTARRGYSFPAYALPILASSVKTRGAKVACINDFYSEDSGIVANAIERTRKAVFISTTFLTKAESIIKIARFARKSNPRIKLIFGGAGIINFPKSRKEADINILYEGEDTTQELAKTIFRCGDTSKIRGISYYKGRKERFTEKRPQIEDLGRTAIPHWQALASKVKAERYLPIESSRGCVGKCSFCLETRYWPGVRFYPVERVTKELKAGIEKFGVRHYYFQDSNISNSRLYLSRLCDAIRKERLGIIWSCESRIDTINEELVDKMYKAGCRAITFGMESADPVVLENMKKGVSAAKMKEFARLVKSMRKKGMIANLNVIVGFPGETEKSVRRTIEFLKYARPIAYSLSKFFLERGTDIWKCRKDFGLKGCMYDWSHRTMKSDDLDPIIRRIFLAVSGQGDIYHWTSASVDLIRHMAKGRSFEEFVKYIKAVNRMCAEDMVRKNGVYSKGYDSSFRYISKYLS